MRTPICDFVREYAEKNMIRLHMPGHKGGSVLGCEKYDITEIEGADNLFHAQSIIKESEENAARLFGSRATFYSTEGASLCVRSAIALVVRYASKINTRPLIFAAANAHQSFLYAAALCRAEVKWLFDGFESDDYMTLKLNADVLRAELGASKVKPVAVYITSPDYLGYIAPVKELAEVCHEHGVLLIVDNAHGSYLHFLTPSVHPLDLDADIVCDSAHKTLPALTGCAYLHVSMRAPSFFAENAVSAMATFATTSPCYLQLCSLDMLNRTLSGCQAMYRDFCDRIVALKEKLTSFGYILCGNEPFKIVLDANKIGYTGVEIATFLRNNGIEVELSDDKWVVLMLTPALKTDKLDGICEAMASLPIKEPICRPAFPTLTHDIKLNLRDVLFADVEKLPVRQCSGRIMAFSPLPCPPAVPVVFPGELLTDSSLTALEMIGVKEINVIANR